jgi:hypothetical protein
MQSDFFLSQRWRAILLANAVLPAGVAVIATVTDLAWWRVIIAVALLASSGWGLFLFRRAIQAPLISFKPDELVLRPMYERKVTRIPRSRVEAIAWANPGTICLRLDSAQLQAVNLTGLTRENKMVVRAQLESWPGGA